jgi:hypothetical protein
MSADVMSPFLMAGFFGLQASRPVFEIHPFFRPEGIFITSYPNKRRRNEQGEMRLKYVDASWSSSPKNGPTSQNRSLKDITCLILDY